MFSLNNIDLTDNATWINEFEGSRVQNTVKYTEDGRKFVFQKELQKREASIILKCELTYETCLKLSAFRDAGNVGILTLEDGRIFSVLLTQIDGAPFFEDTSVFSNDDFFSVKLSFIEV